MGALNLRSAPATVVLTCILLFAWLFTTVGMKLAFCTGAVADDVAETGS